MKILIAGHGKVGEMLTRQLSAENCDITIIDSDQRVLEAGIERYDVIAAHGNCAAMDVLLQADVENADLLIAVTDADEVNLLSCMTAHGINPGLHTIARIRNPEYTEQIYSMRELFDLSLAVNPERQAATEIERLLKYPGFLKRDSFARGRVEIVELKIDEDSRLRDTLLSDLNSIVGCRVLVCSVLRGGKAITPTGSFVLRENDRVFVTAPSNNLETLLKNLGIIKRKVNRVMLVGGGRISYYLASQLLRRGIDVTIIESKRERCVELADQLPAACIINGDASDQNVLNSEGIDGCDAVVSLTGLDELNVLVSLYAHHRGISQIITKLGRLESSSMLNTLPLGSIVSPKELCCSNIVRYVRAMRNQTGAALTVHSIADGQAEAMEFRVDSETEHCGEALKNLKIKRGVLIACISHGSKTDIPNGDSSFESGDTLVIVTDKNTVIYQLNDIFE